MKDTAAYKIFHGIDFNKFPLSLLIPLKTHLYPITSLFVVETPYARFYLDDMVKVTNVDEYCLEDLRPDDVVLDIGACIGGFSLKVHKQVKKVYAVEPIMAKRLRRNIKLNNAENIKVLDLGLGLWWLKKVQYRNIKWAGYNKRTVIQTLPQIIKSCGSHIDFIKIDCEGAEYCIKPEELNGIRRIEAELHRVSEDVSNSIDKHASIEHTPYDFLRTLDKAGFSYQYRELTEELMIVHAWRK